VNCFTEGKEPVVAALYGTFTKNRRPRNSGARVAIKAMAEDKRPVPAGCLMQAFIGLVT
jgi:hypothetical protein